MPSKVAGVGNVEVLVQRLRGAGVDEKRIKAVRVYFEGNHAAVSKHEEAFYSMFAYVAGLENNPPTLSKNLKEESHAFECMMDASASLADDAWNLRLMELVVASNNLESLASWAMGNDRFERFAFCKTMLPKVGVGALEHLRTFLPYFGWDGCERGKLTVFGEALLDASMDHLEALCEGDAASEVGPLLLGMLVAAGRDVPPSLLTGAYQFAAQRSYVAVAMLARDWKRYGEAIEEAVRDIDKARPLFDVGVGYVSTGDATCIDTGWRYMERAMNIRDPYAFEGASFALEAMALDPARGLAFAMKFRETNTTARIDFLQQAVERFGASAAPLVAEGLCEPWERMTLSGSIRSQLTYVARVIKAAMELDLSPYRVRIHQAYGQVKDKKVLEMLHRHPSLGPEKAATRKPPKRFTLPKHRYRIDHYAREVADMAVQTLLAHRNKLAGSIVELGFSRVPEHIQVFGVRVKVDQSQTFEWELGATRTEPAVPESLEESYDDTLLERFLKRHGFDPDDLGSPSWSDDDMAPRCILHFELVSAARRVAGALADAGLHVAETCRFVIDDLYLDGPSFEARTLKSMDMFVGDEVALQEFAALLYEDPDKRAWIVSRGAR